MLEKKVVSQCISSDYCRGWNDAVDAIPRWISVEERLPEQGANVPVVYSDGFVGMGQWLGWGWFVHVWRTTNNVTHWMPLPEPPKEG